MKQRNSSLELLRIICMLAIVCYHYVMWGGFKSFSEYEFSFSVYFLQVLGFFGKIACSVFAIISGYFQITSNKDKIYKKLVPLAAEMFFYYIVILVIMLLTCAVPVSAKAILKSAVPVVYGTWYAVNYLLMCLLAPFINPWLKQMDKKDYRKLLIILFIIWSVIPTLFNPTAVTSDVFDFGSLDFFIIMYIAGAYIRLHVTPADRIHNRRNLKGMLACILFMVLSIAAVDFIGIKTGKSIFIDNAGYLQKFNSIPAVGCAVFAFIYFSNLSFSSKFINTVSGATFGVYLIHNNFLLRKFIWCSVSPNALHAASPYLHAFFKVILVFAACTLIELLRAKTVGRLFENWYYKKYDAKRLRNPE